MPRTPPRPEETGRVIEFPRRPPPPEPRPYLVDAAVAAALFLLAAWLIWRFSPG